jgi:AraC-like DNA-binding protein
MIGGGIHNLFWSNEKKTLGFQHFLHHRRVAYPARLQDENVFVLCLEGSLTVTESGVMTKVRDGELFAGNSHCWRNSEYGAEGVCEGLTLIISPKLLPANAYFGPLRAAPELRRLAEDVLAELGGKQPGKNELLEALANEFLVRAKRLFPVFERPAPPSKRRLLSRRHFVQALDYMQSSPKNCFSLEGLSHSVGVTPAVFSRLFHGSTGKTPLRVYNQLLIEQADAALLRATSIKEVAYNLGFQSPSHFTSLYRKVTGYSPSEMRVFKSRRNI